MQRLNIHSFTVTFIFLVHTLSLNGKKHANVQDVENANWIVSKNWLRVFLQIVLLIVANPNTC